MNLIAVLALATAELNGQPLPDVVLLDFTASYCQPCQQMVPVLQRMERDGFPVRKIDITKQPDVSRQYKVDRIPTLILLVEGQEVERFVGLTAEPELRRQMNDAARKLDNSRRASGAQEVLPEVAVNEQPASTVEPPAKGGIFDRMRQGLFGKAERKTDLERPDFRAQSPEADASDAALANDSKAMNATVRVRLDDGKMRDVGTGTIVHSTAGQSTILTCAHIFKDVSANAAVTVEVFRDGQVFKYPATVVGGDHSSDLSFLQIQNKSPLPMVSLASEPSLPQSQVFSVGCNGGNLPTVLNASIVELNRYEGPENIVCSIDPVQGRSGGGLFNANGQLIGVCSGAFRERKEGLYTGVGAVRSLSTQLQLSALFEDAAPAFADGSQESRNASAEATNPFAQAGDDFEALFSDASTETDAFNEAPDFDSSVKSGFSESQSLPDPFSPATQTTRTKSASAQEMTVIIGTGKPGDAKRVIVVSNPSPWLIELLTGEPAADTNGLATSRAQELSATSARSPQR